MKHSRVTTASFAAVANPVEVLKQFALLGPLAGIAVSLAGVLPASGREVAFVEHIISSTTDGAADIYAADMDGDGDIDVLSASLADDSPHLGEIAWFESDGGSPPSFTKHVISTDVDRSRYAIAKDVDRDGDLDVLSASVADDTIAWYENDGGSPPSFIQHVISNTAIFAAGVFAADIDGDGDIDVLSASRDDSKIAWYESDGGSLPTFTEHLISDTVVGAFSVFAADLDRDGDIDVISAAVRGNEVEWFENDGGSPPTFTGRLISANADGAS